MNLSRIKAKFMQAFVLCQWRAKLLRHARITADEAHNTLWDYYAKEKPLFVQRNIVAPVFDLHIIVPVYNVEKYLDECILSLMNQNTEYTYHVTLVNDGSADASGLILDQYRESPVFTVITKENGGLSSARNAALQEICGRYVMFVDSDDILHENAVQCLLETAFKYDAEIVEGGHQLFSQKGKGNCFVHDAEIQKCKGRDLFGFAWGKVIKSDRLSSFCFPQGYLFEDTVMSTLLHPSCENVCTIPDVVYLYRENEKGITQTSGLSSSCIDTFWIMKYCLDERIRRGQILDMSDFERYLIACYRNWGRTFRMPVYIQESIFILSCELIQQHFGSFFENYSGKYAKLLKTIQAKSFDAFLVVVENWWMM